MKLNLDYYSETASKNESTMHENEIFQYIQNNPESQYDEVLQGNMSLEVFYALSSYRKNIVNWYDFEKKSSILEIGANFGEITGALCDKLARVVAIEASKEKADAIAKRHKQRENLEVVVGKIEEIHLEEKFDYIFLHQANMLSQVKPYIKENTVLLLVADNRFGITYFAGAKPESSNVYSTIINNDTNAFSKNELEKEIKEQGYQNYKFYYPLPNYKMPNVIFSDEYIPNENTTKLMYHTQYPQGSVVVFDELRALKQLTKDGKFTNFANSYLVEIAIQKEDLSEIRFVSYNNSRKKTYQLVTKMYQDRVVKENVTRKGMEHIKTIELNTKKLKKLGLSVIDEINQGRVVSPYIQGETLDKVIIKNILENNLSGAYQLIDFWYEEIKTKLGKDKKAKLNADIVLENKEQVEGLTILKNGYVDLILENTFYQEGKMIFFDQEWYFNGMPLEFILYRAIQNLYSYNGEIQNNIKKEDMFERYGVSSYIPLFEKIETYIQTEIIDQKMQEFNNKSIEKLVDTNYISVLTTQMSELRENDKKQNAYIQALEEDNRKKQEYINILEKKRRIKR